MPEFANPFLFGTIILFIPLVWLYIKRRRSGHHSVPMSGTKLIRHLSAGQITSKLQVVPYVLKIIAIILLIIALARPQSVSTGQNVDTEGIDIILALDISASMRAQDFKPDRAEAAKLVAKQFIAERKNDRIGVVLFAKQAFTQCPLTIDHAILTDLVDDIQIGLVDPDQTAIGQALGVALNRLRTGAGKSRVVILLTDGENNFGQPPSTLADAAKAIGVRVYTIGVGTRGTAPYPVQGIFGRSTHQNVPVNIDEDLLQEIASLTGGKYFRATDEQKLQQIFTEIDKMEKTKIEVQAFRRYAELFYNWAWVALVLLTLGWLMSSVFMRSLV